MYFRAKKGVCSNSSHTLTIYIEIFNMLGFSLNAKYNIMVLSQGDFIYRLDVFQIWLFAKFRC